MIGTLFLCFVSGTAFVWVIVSVVLTPLGFGIAGRPTYNQNWEQAVSNKSHRWPNPCTLPTASFQVWVLVNDKQNQSISHLIVRHLSRLFLVLSWYYTSFCSGNSKFYPYLCTINGEEVIFLRRELHLHPLQLWWRLSARDWGFCVCRVFVCFCLFCFNIREFS